MQHKKGLVNLPRGNYIKKYPKHRDQAKQRIIQNILICIHVYVYIYLYPYLQI